MVKPIPVTEDRIVELAYRLWLEDGQPLGKSSEHWEKARELLAPEAYPEEGKEGIEEARIRETQGEFPVTTDQGERKLPRKPRAGMARKPAKRRPM